MQKMILLIFFLILSSPIILGNSFAGISDGEITDPEIDFEIAPNPTNDVFQLKFNQFTPDGEVCILNLMGQIIRTVKVSQIESLKLDTTEMKEGIYFVCFRTHEINIVKRLVVSSN
ncbi:MAG: T9SS type A sorting domain-containing protein [Crocinitomicaceae bacterium]